MFYVVIVEKMRERKMYGKRILLFLVLVGALLQGGDIRGKVEVYKKGKRTLLKDFSFIKSNSLDSFKANIMPTETASP